MGVGGVGEVLRETGISCAVFGLEDGVPAVQHRGLVLRENGRPNASRFMAQIEAFGIEGAAKKK